uniref:Tick transposon n=1 Tax=Rhipicephalus zambeziensis TaxID=60191 RepID=A0A224Z5Y3_9ACAR
MCRNSGLLCIILQGIQQEHEDSFPLPKNFCCKIVKWYRLNRQTVPSPHPGLTRKEAVLYRQLQTGSLLTPVLAKHVCLSVYESDLCRLCAKERATAAHILWDCNVNPREASEKTTIPLQLEAATRIYDQETQLKAVQQVSAALERQRPSETEAKGAAPPGRGRK